MDISRQAFDLKPFLIRQGALLLWGVPLTRQADVYRIRQLYKLSNFFAEVCYDPATGQPIGICSFSSVNQLYPSWKHASLERLRASQEALSPMI